MKAKSILKSSVLALACIASSTASALDWVFEPHIGADYKFWQLEPKREDATNYFEKTFPDVSRAGTIYIGTRINKVWGIDVGWDNSTTTEKFRLYDSQDFIFDQFSNPGDGVHTDMKLSAWYLSGLYYWEVLCNFELVFHAGIVSLQPKSSIIYYPVNAPVRELSFKTESKFAGRFGFGAQYKFFKYFGARALVTFDNTSRINFVGRNQSNIDFDIRPYKNSTSYNIGLFAELSQV